MKTSALTQAGLERLHQSMAARVENRSLPGIVTLVARGDDDSTDPGLRLPVQWGPDRVQPAGGAGLVIRGSRIDHKLQGRDAPRVPSDSGTARLRETVS